LNKVFDCITHSFNILKWELSIERERQSGPRNFFRIQERTIPKPRMRVCRLQMERNGVMNARFDVARAQMLLQIITPRVTDGKKVTTMAAPDCHALKSYA
jgi:hypothetical protein